MCNACRIASSKTANPVAKRHFVQSAKEVANSTANLVKTIKVGGWTEAIVIPVTPVAEGKVWGLSSALLRLLSSEV